MGTLFTFTGRRKRLSYFLLALAVWVSSMVAQIIVGFVTGAGMAMTHMGTGGVGGPGANVNAGVFVVTLIVMIPFLIAGFALGAQRLHDMGYTGWLQILMLIPIVNIILWLIMLFAPSQKMDNKYGPYSEENYTPAGAPVPQV